MKLLKKMSAFVVAFTFLFVFSIKANAAEKEYKVGDKVLFGDFGGHVIEDSSSSSNTVKVFVDGWNKTPDEWYKFWNSKLADSLSGKWDLSKVESVYKASLDNLTGVSFRDIGFNDLKSYVTLYPLKFTWSTDKSITTYDENNSTNELMELVYIKDNVDSWIIYPNIYSHEAKIEYKCIENGTLTSENVSTASTCNQYVLGVYQTNYLNSTTNTLYQMFMPYNNWYNYHKNHYRAMIEYYHYNATADNAKYVSEAPEGQLYGEEVLPYQVITLNKSDLDEIIECPEVNKNFTVNYVWKSNSGDEKTTRNYSYNSGNGTKLDFIPEREGYIFDGWYTDESLKTQVNIVNPNEKKDTNSCVTGYGDITVYGKWTKSEVKTTTTTTTKVVSKDGGNVVNNPNTGDNIILYFIIGLGLITGTILLSKKLKSAK